jgi:hypothetical protein
MRFNSRAGRSAAWLAAAAALLAATAADAHHSGAMFDRQKTVEIKGVIKDFAWTNPHASVAIDVKGAGGGAEQWNIETGSPTVMIKAGWRKTSLKPGDNVTLYIHPMRDGSKGGDLVGAILADGSKVGGGPG